MTKSSNNKPHKQARLAAAIAEGSRIADELRRLNDRVKEVEAMQQRNIGAQNAYADVDLPEDMNAQDAINADHDGLRSEVELLLSKK